MLRALQIKPSAEGYVGKQKGLLRFKNKRFYQMRRNFRENESRRQITNTNGETKSLHVSLE